MSKMFQLYGVGQALFQVLPPPLPFQNAPTSNQTNYEIGQLVYTPPKSPTAFYLYGGGGNWVEFATNTGNILAVNGTANQITATTAAGVATLSLPSAITAPGSLTTTTSLTATTTVTAGTGITATTGNIAASAGNVSASGTVTGGTGVTATTGALTATNGNLVLGTVGNKLQINTGANASCGLSSAMSGSPGAVTVATTACTASSIILYSRATTGGTPGQVSITAQSTSGFTLTSTGNETSTFNWLIIN